MKSSGCSQSALSEVKVEIGGEKWWKAAFGGDRVKCGGNLDFAAFAPHSSLPRSRKSVKYDRSLTSPVRQFTSSANSVSCPRHCLAWPDSAIRHNVCVWYIPFMNNNWTITLLTCEPFDIYELWSEWWPDLSDTNFRLDLCQCNWCYFLIFIWGLE